MAFHDGVSKASPVWVAGILVAVLAGCTVGPDYRPPQPVVPVAFHEVPQTGAPIEPLARDRDFARWWTVFSDPVLDSLIDRAVEANKDLMLAQARIREARALRRVVAADAYPSVNTSAAYSRSQRSENTSSSPVSRGSSDAQDLFQAGFDASWEIDVFGGVRRSVEAASADIEASEESRRDVLVSVVSEVALNYLQVRGGQLRIRIARENIGAQRQTVDLTRERFTVGLGTELQVAQAKAQLATTEAQVPAFETATRQAIHRIGALLGQEPGALLDELSKEGSIPPVPPEVPVGLPSELLRRRPDVRRAERQLAAATARIGVATADLFPRFSLTGALGQQSIHFSDIARPESTFWSIGPSVRWPIFDAGRIRANIEIQDARQEQALASYEQAVLTSLQDVEDALVAYFKEQETRRALGESVEASRKAVDISDELYTKGLVDFLNVLVNQRALYLAEDALAESTQRVSSNLVALFKALGGGWEVETME